MGRRVFGAIVICLAAWPMLGARCSAQIVFDDIDPGKPAKRSIDPHELWIEPMQPPIQPPKPSATKPGFHEHNILPHPTQFEPLHKDNMPPDNLMPRRLRVSPLHVDTIVQPNIAPRPMVRTIEPGRRLALSPIPARPSHDFDPRMEGSGHPSQYFDSSIFLLPNSRPTTVPRGSLSTGGRRTSVGRTEAQRAPSSRRRLGW